jgi:hypothetical protein
MSRIRLAVTENVLSDPGRITGGMYEDYLEKSGRAWVAEDRGEIGSFATRRTRSGRLRVFDHQLHLGDAVVFVGVEPEGDAGALT